MRLDRYRVVVYQGQDGFLMGYKLTSEDAKDEKRKLIRLGLPPEVIFIEEYTRNDYITVKRIAYRVKVVLRAPKYEYTNYGVKRMVDRGRTLILGSGLTKDAAEVIRDMYLNTFHKPRKVVDEYGKVIVKNTVIVESYGLSDQIEIHKDLDQDYWKFEPQTKEEQEKNLPPNEIVLEGKKLKHDVLNNLTFVGGFHSVNKDTRFVPGQLDFDRLVIRKSRYNYSDSYGTSDNRENIPASPRFVPEISIPILNPYTERGGYSSIAHLKDKRGKFQYDDPEVENLLVDSKFQLTYGQFFSMIKEFYARSTFTSLQRFLTKCLYFRNDLKKDKNGKLVHSPLNEKVFCLININVIKFNKSYFELSKKGLSDREIFKRLYPNYVKAPYAKVQEILRLLY